MIRGHVALKGFFTVLVFSLFILLIIVDTKGIDPFEQDYLDAVGSISLSSIADLLSSTVVSDSGHNYGFRPLTALSQAIINLIAPDAPLSWQRLFNLLFHFVNVVLLYAILVFRPKEDLLGGKPVAWRERRIRWLWPVGLTLFAFHPLHLALIQSVQGRSVLLATMVLLGGVLWTLRFYGSANRVPGTSPASVSTKSPRVFMTTLLGIGCLLFLVDESFLPLAIGLMVFPLVCPFKRDLPRTYLVRAAIVAMVVCLLLGFRFVLVDASQINVELSNVLNSDIGIFPSIRNPFLAVQGFVVGKAEVFNQIFGFIVAIVKWAPAKQLFAGQSLDWFVPQTWFSLIIMINLMLGFILFLKKRTVLAAMTSMIMLAGLLSALFQFNFDVAGMPNALYCVSAGMSIALVLLLEEIAQQAWVLHNAYRLSRVLWIGCLFLIGVSLVSVMSATSAVTSKRIAYQYQHDHSRHMLVKLSALYLQQGEFHAARVTARRGVAAFSKDSRLIATKATIDFLQGDYTFALRGFSKAYQYAPNNHRLLSQIGFCAAVLGEYNIAQTLLQTSAHNRPKQYQVHLLLGRLWAKIGDDQAARRALSQALKLHPRDEQVMAALNDLRSQNSEIVNKTYP